MGSAKNAYKTLLLTNSGEQAIDENRSDGYFILWKNWKTNSYFIKKNIFLKISKKLEKRVDKRKVK